MKNNIMVFKKKKFPVGLWCFHSCGRNVFYDNNNYGYSCIVCGHFFNNATMVKRMYRDYAQDNKKIPENLCNHDIKKKQSLFYKKKKLPKIKIITKKRN